jgi:hypothetical protein
MAAAAGDTQLQKPVVLLGSAGADVAALPVCCIQHADTNSSGSVLMGTQLLLVLLLPEVTAACASCWSPSSQLLPSAGREVSTGEVAGQLPRSASSRDSTACCSDRGTAMKLCWLPPTVVLLLLLAGCCASSLAT